MIELRLRHAASRASAAAWPIPGEDVEAWIEEIPPGPDEPKKNPAAQAGGCLKRQLGKAKLPLLTGDPGKK